MYSITFLFHESSASGVYWQRAVEPTWLYCNCTTASCQRVMTAAGSSLPVVIPYRVVAWPLFFSKP